MNEASVFALLHLFLLRKQRLNHDINDARLECRLLVRRYRRRSKLQNKLIITLLMLIDKSLEIDRLRV
ncbi:unnamed protein product [Rotaria sp. Silwood2]|nr:unnamed protein product [Rotaria sp. Silwood2]CAF3026671.1 unnamed protein product [Rotaria sp. Silwood2]CAF3217577.1 unnamed protein product [Rotaria sp. Silwood2]CAF4035422.1 unnamed protein product [Rotaria sp. Silwood2]CAF4065462.1 unnamed protein product [Rotaria sp. Silwood2]